MTDWLASVSGKFPRIQQRRVVFTIKTDGMMPKAITKRRTWTVDILYQAYLWRRSSMARICLARALEFRLGLALGNLGLESWAVSWMGLQSVVDQASTRTSRKILAKTIVVLGCDPN